MKVTSDQGRMAVARVWRRQEASEVRRKTEVLLRIIEPHLVLDYATLPGRFLILAATPPRSRSPAWVRRLVWRFPTCAAR